MSARLAVRVCGGTLAFAAIAQAGCTETDDYATCPSGCQIGCKCQSSAAPCDQVNMIMGLLIGATFVVFGVGLFIYNRKYLRNMKGEIVKRKTGHVIKTREDSLVPVPMLSTVTPFVSPKLRAFAASSDTDADIQASTSLSDGDMQMSAIGNDNNMQSPRGGPQSTPSGPQPTRLRAWDEPPSTPTQDDAPPVPRRMSTADPSLQGPQLRAYPQATPSIAESNVDIAPPPQPPRLRAFSFGNSPQPAGAPTHSMALPQGEPMAAPSPHRPDINTTVRVKPQQSRPSAASLFAPQAIQEADDAPPVPRRLSVTESQSRPGSKVLLLDSIADEDESVADYEQANVHVPPPTRSPPVPYPIAASPASSYPPDPEPSGPAAQTDSPMHRQPTVRLRAFGSTPAQPSQPQPQPQQYPSPQQQQQYPSTQPYPQSYQQSPQYPSQHQQQYPQPHQPYVQDEMPPVPRRTTLSSPPQSTQPGSRLRAFGTTPVAQIDEDYETPTDDYEQADDAPPVPNRSAHSLGYPAYQ